MHLRFKQVFVCLHISFIKIAELYGYTSLSTHLTEGYLGCFHFLVIINKDASNIRLPVLCGRVFNLTGQTARLDYFHMAIFSFVRNCQTVF